MDICMNPRFKIPARPLIVYTDLDGTLMDHDDYSFQAAVPALQRLEQLNVPIIPVTSKTLAELEVLNRELGLKGPCIAENGGLIAFPADYFETPPPLQSVGQYEVEFLSPDYTTILDMLADLRQSYGFNFTGFADLSDAEVAELTGLSIDAAQLARRRLCSEPLVWNDGEEAFKRFVQELGKRRYTLVKGGRFWHVLGQTDKALAIRQLDGFFSDAGCSDFTRIALGDSPNDTPMLQAADIAVVIRRKDGSWLQVETAGEQVKTRASGPEGWNEFFQQYLDGLDSAQGTHRTIHG
jgi:mannosyl-3-phosphoglycerate phosphatase